jgi:hypothetical protein
MYSGEGRDNTVERRRPQKCKRAVARRKKTKQKQKRKGLETQSVTTADAGKDTKNNKDRPRRRIWIKEDRGIGQTRVHSEKFTQFCIMQMM